MSRRAWKVAALVFSGGICLQLSACVGVALQVVGQEIITNLISSLVDGIRTAGETTTP